MLLTKMLVLLPPHILCVTGVCHKKEQFVPLLKSFWGLATFGTLYFVLWIAVAQANPLSSICCPDYEYMELYLSSTIHIHVMVHD
jgi:hypothetical protein